MTGGAVSDVRLAFLLRLFHFPVLWAKETSLKLPNKRKAIIYFSFHPFSPNCSAKYILLSRRRRRRRRRRRLRRAACAEGGRAALEEFPRECKKFSRKTLDCGFTPPGKSKCIPGIENAHFEIRSVLSPPPPAIRPFRKFDILPRERPRTMREVVRRHPAPPGKSLQIKFQH